MNFGDTSPVSGSASAPGVFVAPGLAAGGGAESGSGGEGVNQSMPMPVVVPAAQGPHPGEAESGSTGERSVLEMVEQPAKVMRIGTMIKQLLDEVRNAPMDDAGRARLAEIHERSVKELEDGLAPELIEELHRISLPFADADDDTPPTDAELRIAQAQLVGWLEGLFHGIQAAVYQQQALAQVRQQALPAGRGGAHGSGPDSSDGRPTGQYL